MSNNLEVRACIGPNHETGFEKLIVYYVIEPEEPFPQWYEEKNFLIRPTLELPRRYVLMSYFDKLRECSELVPEIISAVEDCMEAQYKLDRLAGKYASKLVQKTGGKFRTKGGLIDAEKVKEIFESRTNLLEPISKFFI